MVALAMSSLPVAEALILVALLCILADVFFLSDVLTHVGYVLCSVALAVLMPVSLPLRALAAVVLWFAMVAGHYWLWRTFLQSVAHNLLAPRRYAGGAENLIGLTGSVELIEGNLLVRLRGELWPFRPLREVDPGGIVRVMDVENGTLVITPVGAS